MKDYILNCLSFPTYTAMYFKKVNVLIAIAILLVLSGCGSTDEKAVPKNAPVITEVDVHGNTIIVMAEDDVEVKGYLITRTNEEPSVNDPKWKESSLFTVDEDGTYYIWAKDTDGNICQPKTADVSRYGALERLAPEYDHLAWYLDNSATKTVDGKEYNLNELRQQYGNLYRFVEPLSKEEIEQRFEYIVNFIIASEQTGDLSYGRRYNSGIEERKLGESYVLEYRDVENDYRSKIYNNEKNLISKYKNYYYSRSDDRYVLYLPSSFDSSTTSYKLGADIISRIPLNDKDWFVRDFMTGVDLSINLAKEMELNLDFFFDPEVGYKK